MPKVIEAINPKGQTLRGDVEHLARLMVQIHGCYTSKQTADALADQVAVNQGKTITSKGWTVKLVEVEEKSA